MSKSSRYESDGTPFEEGKYLRKDWVRMKDIQKVNGPVHMLKESKVPKEGNNRKPVLVGLCGVEGPAMGVDFRGIRTTGWVRDVTCPICKRMPSVKKYVDQQKAMGK